MPSPVRTPEELRWALLEQVQRGRLRGVRRLRRLPARQPPARPEALYRAWLQGQVRGLAVYLRRELLAAAPQLATRDDVRLDQLDWLAVIFGRARARALHVEDGREDGVLQRVFRAIASVTRQRWIGDVDRVLGVQPELSEPWLTPMADRFASDNARLITAVSGDFMARVEALVREAQRDGIRAEELRAEIRDRLLGDGYETEVGKATRRARLIARDQVGKLTSELDQARQEALGVTRYRWRTSRDERVRDSHRERDGVVFEWSDIEPQLRAKGLEVDRIDGHPGRPINCFPASVRLDALDGARKLFRHFYTGELATLVTDDGARLSGTPNHPILTGRGWLPLKAVQVGDHVFRARRQGGLIREDDVAAHQPSGGESFEALRGCATRPPELRGEFHGDGSGDQVDVVDIDGRLGVDGPTSTAQLACQELLAWADQATPGLRSLPQIPLGARPAADGLVRGARKLLALLGAEAAHAKQARLAAPPGLDAALQQAVAEGAPCDAMLSRSRELAHAGDVVLDSRVLVEVLAVVRGALPVLDRNAIGAERLTEVVRSDPELLRHLGQGHALAIEPLRVAELSLDASWSGHVFNLETDAGWYSADSLIVHNCRCTAEAVLEDLVPGLPPV